MLEINFRKFKTVAILGMTGTIDIDSSNLIETVGWCLENGFPDILCDFSNISLIDYAGLSVITIAYKNVLNHKGRMKLLNVSESIKKILSLVCLDRVFEVFDDETLAIRSFEEDRIISEIKKKQLRRRFKRLPLDINVEFRLFEREETFYEGKILNLSAVGLLVFSNKVYRLGDVLELRLSLLPKPGFLEIAGKVVWLVQKEIQPQIYPGMGIEFYRLTSETQRKIVDFVDRNLPLGSASES